jgi:hypothetical protein
VMPPARDISRQRAKSAVAAVRTRRAPATKAQEPRSTGRRSASVRAAEPVAPSGRAYRRMPDADEVLAAYREVGTVSGLADFFGVPRHTVQGWARRLRSEGYTIGQGA